MGRSRYAITDHHSPHFMTATVNNWIALFTRPATVEIILESWRYLQKTSGFQLYGYVILENHLHLVAQSPMLGKDMQAFKSWTARRILDYLQEQNVAFLLRQFSFHKLQHKTDSHFQLWQEGNHPQLIESEQVLRQKLNYIHHNPVKRGYVDLPEHWCYSSARNYLGQKGMIEVFVDW